MLDTNIDELAKIVVDAAYHVHIELGPGLLESAYEACLIFELIERGLKVESQVPLPLTYKNIKLDCGFRVDILVEGKLILEIKSVSELQNIHLAQCITYLKLSDLNLALLINFNTTKIKNGIRRVINGQLLN